MKTISIGQSIVAVLAIVFSAALPFSLQAEEVKYVATLTGVECSGCKKAIAKSLAKIDGVEKIRIEKGANGTHKMTVTTNGSVSISKQRAAAAIQHAEHYQIKSWARSS